MASRAAPSARSPPPPRKASSSSSSSSTSSPAAWLAAYDAFITKNVGQVSQIESTLRSLTYIIPGRFRDAEMASEAIHAGVQLLALYHDQLLQRTPAVGRGLPSPPPSPHTRYTRYWTAKSALYRRAAVALQVLRYTELLCEMAAKRRGERVRWRVVVLIEAAKALCRLLLLRVTGGRTTVNPPLPERQALGEQQEDEEEEEEEEEQQEGEEGEETNDNNTENNTKIDNNATTNNNNNTPPTPPLSPVPTAKSLAPAGARPPSPPSTEAGASASAPFTTTTPPPPANQPWPMPRTGLALPPLPQPGDTTAYLLSRVLTADAIRPPATLLARPRAPAALAAEVLHILVPVVYAAALANLAASRKQKSRAAAWAPWLAGVAMEAAARQLRPRDGLRTTTLEREEWTRRGWALGWWAMRGACYEQAVQGVVAGVRARLPGFVGGIVEDYEYLWANYYFSTSP